MTRCISTGCTRRRLPHRNRCDDCIRVLLDAIFGQSDRLAR